MKKSEELTLEKFGEIMDQVLTENEVQMLITLPEGTQEAKLQDNLHLGGVPQFYILLKAVKAAYRNIHDLIDNEDEEEFVDGMMEMLKQDIMESLVEQEGDKKEG